MLQSLGLWLWLPSGVSDSYFTILPALIAVWAALLLSLVRGLRQAVYLRRTGARIGSDFVAAGVALAGIFGLASYFLSWIPVDLTGGTIFVVGVVTGGLMVMLVNLWLSVVFALIRRVLVTTPTEIAVAEMWRVAVKLDKAATTWRRRETRARLIAIVNDGSWLEETMPRAIRFSRYGKGVVAEATVRLRCVSRFLSARLAHCGLSEFRRVR